MPSSRLNGSPRGWQIMKRIIERLGAAICVLVFVWLAFSGRISYAVAECSKGAGACMLGVAVAMGIVDITDKNGQCVGVGCKM